MLVRMFLIIALVCIVDMLCSAQINLPDQQDPFVLFCAPCPASVGFAYTPGPRLLLQTALGLLELLCPHGANS